MKQSSHTIGKTDWNLSRRDFLSTSALALAGAALSGCATTATTEPIIDIHQHVNYSDRPDEILLKPFDERQLLRALVPATTATTAPVSTMLTEDPDLLALLREELPHQFAALESAFTEDDLDLARESAHTLHGTAAFYHLTSLRQSTAALEHSLKRVQAIAGDPRVAEQLNAVRTAVAETLTAIARKSVATRA